MSTKNVVVGSLATVALSAGAVVGMGVAANAAAPHAPTAAQTSWVQHHFSQLPASNREAIALDLRAVHTSQDGIARARHAIAADLRADRSATADRNALKRAQAGLVAGVNAFRADEAKAAQEIFTPQKQTATPAWWAMHHLSKLSPSTRTVLLGDLRDVYTSQDGVARATRAVATDVRTRSSAVADRQALARAERGLRAGLAALHADATAAGVNYAN